MTKDYADNGVTINPANPLYHDSVEIVYEGLLSGSGASEVFAHVGFDLDWKAVQDYRMEKTGHGFTTTVFLPEDATILNICFRDPVGNWDNNSGSNYTFTMEAKHSPVNPNYSFLTETGEDLTKLLTGDFS
ncbi:MAG: carbohydrate-binding protein [Negativicutes bacterium]|nr:carbohydrate-binding protein [Negativicutes bacterium]